SVLKRRSDRRAIWKSANPIFTKPARLMDNPALAGHERFDEIKKDSHHRRVRLLGRGTRAVAAESSACRTRRRHLASKRRADARAGLPEVRRPSQVENASLHRPQRRSAGEAG